MRLPKLQGLIRRRLLVNYRADPEIVSHLLPPAFRPKLHRGYAIVGLCLIRLEETRAVGVPRYLGLSSENAAHRMAVEWDDPSGPKAEGVYISRRDTGSWVNHVAGGRLFPGEHHLSSFEVQDDDTAITLSMVSKDHVADVTVTGSVNDCLPPTSCFQSLEESSSFFRAGSVGYSATRDSDRLDGLRLQIQDWKVSPFEVLELHSNYFADPAVFPEGSITFDHALLMREAVHAWHQEADFAVSPAQP